MIGLILGSLLALLIDVKWRLIVKCSFFLVLFFFFLLLLFVRVNPSGLDGMPNEQQINAGVIKYSKNNQKYTFWWSISFFCFVD